MLSNFLVRYVISSLSKMENRDGHGSRWGHFSSHKKRLLVRSDEMRISGIMCSLRGGWLEKYAARTSAVTRSVMRCRSKLLSCSIP
ncbi:hypothetical protein ElyMa_000963700 [Elysia marginata]|uniref:Uncharacterized protein n=1 Tax=Elysia marginata TaxID=1093978 RepID=A0AAV4HHE2_9GAST|nr:hypothetical protein ElyMa_000963700 [Elysia marginata]